MSATPDSTLANPEQRIADLERQLAERTAERDEASRRLDERTAERDEALDQQTATAEVLQVINSSPGDLAPVFDAILEKAHSLCGVAFGSLQLYEDGKFRAVAVRGLPSPIADRLRAGYRPGPKHPMRRLLDGDRFVHIHDLSQVDTSEAQVAVEHGSRTLLFIPLRKDDALLGQIVAVRQEVRPFTDKQIALLQNFAAQAVIAMENARLITETREALEQQTATAEVLEVINSSPGDLTPVFDAILEKAMDLCGAAFGELHTYDGKRSHTAALRGVPTAYAEVRAKTPPSGRPGTGAARMLETKRPVHILDVMAGEGYRAGDAGSRALVDLGGARSCIGVPLLKDEAVVGFIMIYRQEIRPFSEKEITLLENFAAQAVIAMENARLITETREALEQQTATSEVLQVINTSPGDLKPVFDAVLKRAMGLCEAAFGMIHTIDRAALHLVAQQGIPPHYAEFTANPANQPGPGGATPRLMRDPTLRFVHVIDLKEEEAYRSGDPYRRALVDLGGARTLLAIPLRKDGVMVGVINIYRQEVRAYSHRQIALLQNFAAQAVIAMENARLLGALRERTSDLQESLEYQTATSDVLKVISRSTFDLQPVLDTLVETAARLCEADMAFITSREREVYRTMATFAASPEFVAILRKQTFTVDRATLTGRTALDGRVVHITDLAADPDYGLTEAVTVAKARVGLGVPLLREGIVVGTLNLARHRAEPFTERQIELVRTFADQAAIAIENARLLGELRQRTGDLEQSLEYQTATSDVLKVISRSTFDLQPVLDTLVETATRLCNADMATLLTRDGDVYLPVAYYAVSPEWSAISRSRTWRPGDANVVGRTLLERRVVHVLDVAAEPRHHPEAVTVGGIRTALGVPLLREGDPIGTIHLARRRVEPFTERQIDLVRTFADQAVIAMENARLITETREALRQQTATAEVLRVISSSPTNVQPTFEAIAARATTLCEAISGGVFQFDGSLIHLVAQYGWTPEELATIHSVFPIAPGRGSVTARAILTREVAHVADMTADPEYAYPSIAQSGLRTVLVVPMLRDGNPLGAINVSRREVQPFSETQIELLKTFADQAVIAIENVRLFNELQERTDELAHSVEELKTLSEVSQAVSSTLDLEQVLSAILSHCVALSGADAGVGFRYSRTAHAYRLVEARGWDAELVAQVRGLHIDETETGMGEAARQRAPLQISDLATRPSYPLRDITLAAGFRSVLIVPLLGSNRVYGAMVLERRAAGEFSDRTVQLMQALASQSVLAIQNARLLGEVQAGRDAAEEANRNLKAAQANLIQAEKMASLGQLTAGIAHEIKNPLNFVNNFASLSNELLDELKDEAEPALATLADDKRAEIDETLVMLSGNLEKIAEHGKRADNIVKSMLEHSRGVSGERREVDLNNLIEEALNLSYHGARAQNQDFNITLERDYAASLKPIELAPQEITRVFLNLFGNGFYAASKRARANGDGSFRPVLAVATCEADDAVEVRVRDNGTGIAPEIRDKLFQPFFTTKPTGEGTGLGLSISYDIVTQQHGGTITVDSEEGAYTEFTISLPRH